MRELDPILVGRDAEATRVGDHELPSFENARTWTKSTRELDSLDYIARVQMDDICGTTT